MKVTKTQTYETQEVFIIDSDGNINRGFMKIDRPIVKTQTSKGMNFDGECKIESIEVNNDISVDRNFDNFIMKDGKHFQIMSLI
ncbi:hypothetical protein [Acinetobacter sp.]|uniref:hypothetical protein n=1 Tax=Acinetobacter sp. TaxID=472 RepID=UPI0035B47EE9